MKAKNRLASSLRALASLLLFLHRSIAIASDVPRTAEEASRCDAGGGGACDDGATASRPSSSRPLPPPRFRSPESSALCPDDDTARRRDGPPAVPASVEARVERFYRAGASAQAYKPGAPSKAEVCAVPGRSDRGSDRPQRRSVYRVARRPWWRGSRGDPVPLLVRCDVYGCGTDDRPSLLEVEVWQPRPDGTYSSLRPGAEEGDCRATVPAIVANVGDERANFLGRAEFETLAPGSPGALGGIVPGGARDRPPYGPGAVHLYLDAEGYEPWLGQLDVNQLGSQMEEGVLDRFRFRGRDLRPHSAKSAGADGAGGVEVRSVKRATYPGYDLALEVDLDVFLVPSGEAEATRDDKGGSGRDVFCSERGYFGWMPSFFKEPIAVCFPSMLDFFAL